MDNTVATISTNDSIAGDTYDPELNAGDDHDQLPSVEEYKANMIPGAISSGDSAVSNFEIGDDDDGPNGNDGNQLPCVDEYKVSMAVSGAGAGVFAAAGGNDDAAVAAATGEERSPSRRRGMLPLICLGAVFLVAAIIPLAIILPKSDDNSSRSSVADSDDVEQVKLREQPLPIEDVLSHLVEFAATPESILRTEGTPQNLAAKWIAETDLYDIEMDGGNEHSYFIQRYSLAVLYFATDGANWDYGMNFLKPTSVCNWNQLFRSGLNRYRLGVYSCRENDSIVRLGLPQNGLSGSIPDEIMHLDQMDALIMPWNLNLTSTIPTTLSALTDLKTIDLGYCGLTGEIPSMLSSLTQLTALTLGNNYMDGTVPYESLPKMVDLSLDDNGFTGDINEFNGMMPDLKYLYLEDNGFDGKLNNDLIQYWGKTVIELDISDNDFAEDLPADLFSPDNAFVIMDLHGNQFSGVIPTLQQENTKLRFLAMHENKLDGFVPASLNKLVKLAHLDISRNELEGSLPSALGDLSLLRYLHTSDNSFTAAPMPEFIARLTSLRELSMKHNKIKGQIPTWIGNLTSVQLLDLDSNELEGPIPSELGLILGLVHLLLNRNELTGEIPDEVKKLYDLDVVMLDHNEINGTLNFFCDDPKFDKFAILTSDCKGANKEITCDCCTLCCEASDLTCNQYEYFVNLDPIREYGYNRRVHSYSIKATPVGGGGGV